MTVQEKAAALAAAAAEPAERLRVVLSGDDRRLLNRAIAVLGGAGLAMVVCCRRCNEPMKPEAADQTNGAGYGCRCSRVHFR
jgi:hypothetical protein